MVEFKLNDNEYILHDEDLQIKCKKNFNGSTSCYEKSMREMVNKNPDVFTGKRWDEWRDEKSAQAKKNDDTVQRQKEIDGVPF